MSQFSVLQKKLTKNGKQDQAHLLKFWEELTENERGDIITDLNEIDIDEVLMLFETACKSLQDEVQKLDDRMKPIPQFRHDSYTKCSSGQISCYENMGLEEISQGHVGVLLMAGGQGTRLGVTYPKGMYCVNLPSKKSLFQIQAERIIRLQQLADKKTGCNGKITWYIMTSEPTIEPTREFFVKNKYFGLEEQNIVMFKQGLLPCFDFEGKILLDQKGKISQAPDGNGGIYRALRDRGILNDMIKRGIKYLHAHSVDNILVRVADPVFLGYCINRNAECGAKVVRKVSPTEAVGVVCMVDDKYRVVEYSEITDKTAELKRDDGSLTFDAGNICNHFFTTDFLTRIAYEHEKQFQVHVAKKKIPYVDSDGIRRVPEKPNGIKIEKFIFDSFEYTKEFVTWEVPREDEFSALKNSDSSGKDCPSTVRSDLFALHKRFITKAGGIVEGDICEVSPLLSYAGEELEEYVKEKIFVSPILLKSPSEEC